MNYSQLTKATVNGIRRHTAEAHASRNDRNRSRWETHPKRVLRTASRRLDSAMMELGR